MSRPTNTPSVPITRLSYRREEAAAALGISPDHFDAHVRHELRAVRLGRVVLYPASELQRWLEKTASRVLDQEEVVA